MPLGRPSIKSTAGSSSRTSSSRENTPPWTGGPCLSTCTDVTLAPPLRRLSHVCNHVCLPLCSLPSPLSPQPSPLLSSIFRYPARPDVPIFTGLNLVAEAGKTLALVGGSGSGKSTVVALVMRWYNPSSGRILIDGNDLCSLQLRWLRSQVPVCLEPTSPLDVPST